MVVSKVDVPEFESGLVYKVEISGISQPAMIAMQHENGILNPGSIMSLAPKSLSLKRFISLIKKEKAIPFGILVQIQQALKDEAFSSWSSPGKDWTLHFYSGRSLESAVKQCAIIEARL